MMTNENLLCLDWPSDELYLPPMRKIDSILSDQKRRLLRKVSMSSQHQVTCPKYAALPSDYPKQTLNQLSLYVLMVFFKLVLVLLL